MKSVTSSACLSVIILVAWLSQAMALDPSPFPLRTNIQTPHPRVELSSPRSGYCKVLSRQLEIKCEISRSDVCELTEHIVAAPRQACTTTRWNLSTAPGGADLKDCTGRQCELGFIPPDIDALKLVVRHLPKLAAATPKHHEGPWATGFTQARYPRHRLAPRVSRVRALRFNLKDAAQAGQLGVTPIIWQLREQPWIELKYESRDPTHQRFGHYERLNFNGGMHGLGLYREPPHELTLSLRQLDETPLLGASAEVGLWSIPDEGWEVMGRAALEVVELPWFDAKVPFGGALALEASARRAGGAVELHYGGGLRWLESGSMAAHLGLASELIPDPALYLRARVSVQRGPFGLAVGRDLASFERWRGRWLVSARMTF